MASNRRNSWDETRDRIRMIQSRLQLLNDQAAREFYTRVQHQTNRRSPEPGPRQQLLASIQHHARPSPQQQRPLSTSQGPTQQQNSQLTPFQRQMQARLQLNKSPQHAKPSSSKSPQQIRPNQTSLSRPVSHEENNYFQTLLATIHSPSALDLRAMHYNESIPQSRQNLRQQISEFLRNTTSIRPPDKQFYPPGTLFATTSTNLIEVCQKASGMQTGKREKGISLAEFQRRRREAVARREKDSQNAARMASTARLSGSSIGAGEQRRLRTGDDGSSSRLDDANLGEDTISTTESKGKGKRRARRRIWDDEDEEGDILDTLD